jgi:hypothetical protein
VTAMSMRERIAQAILKDLSDRRGIRHVLECVDDDVMQEIREALADAVLSELLTPTKGMVEALIDDQTPFICRRKMDKSGYEIVEQKNPDWRDVVADPMEVVAEFYNSDEAWAEHARIEAKWKFHAAIQAAKEGK